MTLTTPISQITTIGKRVAPALKKIGLHTAGDLLLYWPYRYEDWSRVLPVSELVAGEKVTVRVTVNEIKDIMTRGGGKTITHAKLSDDTGTLHAVWFNQKYITKSLRPNMEIFLSGKVEYGNKGIQFTQPVYERVSNKPQNTTHTARIVPVYSLTRAVTQKQIRYLLTRVLPVASDLREWLPRELVTKYNLLGRLESIRHIHFPETHEKLERAKHRLKFEELFLINLRSFIAKSSLKKKVAQKIEFKKKETQSFVNKLPFKLTDAQRKSSWEILKDLGTDTPMNRLLEGDVGSGKTLVSAIGALNVLLNDYQVAYMAPTEILAIQQFESFARLFDGHDFTIVLLTGSKAYVKQPEKETSKAQKTKILQLIKNGNANLIVGTHSLIQRSVSYKNLALAIVDEQHRFGVDQRAKLNKNITDKKVPHFLSMTATPIPRSLALTLYGDLDISIINQMPKGRKPIKTKLVPPEKRGENYKFVLDQISKGRQAFVICPLVDPSDKLGKKAVTEEYKRLSSDIFPSLRIGLLHGKMKPAEKEGVMRKFASHELDILVSTSVIEVGVDVPNSTVIIIESAERFGLAQLHQFRGRVGRGEHQSYCLLFTESTTRETRNRLQALVDTNDGFELAKRDLEFRGPGEVYGIKQHGFDDMLKLAKLTDYLIIKEVQEAVPAILSSSPDLSKYPLLKERLDKFEQTVHLE